MWKKVHAKAIESMTTPIAVHGRQGRKERRRVVDTEEASLPSHLSASGASGASGASDASGASGASLPPFPMTARADGRSDMSLLLEATPSDSLFPVSTAMTSASETVSRDIIMVEQQSESGVTESIRADDVSEDDGDGIKRERGREVKRVQASHRPVFQRFEEKEMRAIHEQGISTTVPTVVVHIFFSLFICFLLHESLNPYSCINTHVGKLLGLARLRFIPKPTGIRPIVNLSRHVPIPIPVSTEALLPTPSHGEEKEKEKEKEPGKEKMKGD